MRCLEVQICLGVSAPSGEKSFEVKTANDDCSDLSGSLGSFPESFPQSALQRVSSFFVFSYTLEVGGPVEPTKSKDCAVRPVDSDQQRSLAL